MGSKPMAPAPIPIPDGPGGFSTTKTAGSAKLPCPPPVRKVVSIKWEDAVKWCSEMAIFSGSTSNYGNGESVTVTVTDSADATKVAASLMGKVNGNGFRHSWNVVNVLPSRAGAGGYAPRKPVDCRAEGARSATPLQVRFVLNYPMFDARDTRVKYTRIEPMVPEQTAAPAIPEQPEVPEVPAKDGKPAIPGTPYVPPVPEKKYKAMIPEKTVYPELGCNFEMDLVNGLVTVYGRLKYVKGWAKERLELNLPKIGGGFQFKGSTTTVHWSRVDPGGTTRRYWDGKAWQKMPKDWKADGSNMWADTFYWNGGKWVCRGHEDENIEYTPEKLTAWPDAVLVAKKRTAQQQIDLWKAEIEKAWSEKFDIKRKDCKSSLPECCRYKVRVVITFEEVKELGPHDLVLCYENVRSYSTMWSLADDRDDYLGPHEFGHLLGAPDEYDNAPTTQLGIKDDDGLDNGKDTTSLMCGGGVVKKRHFKGIRQAMQEAVKKEYGRDYEFIAVDKGASLALPPGTAAVKDTVMAAEKRNVETLATVGGTAAVKDKATVAEKRNAKTQATVGGAAAGALAGALIGSLITGWKSENLGLGVGIGAAVGGVAGGVAGYFLGQMIPAGK